MHVNDFCPQAMLAAVTIQWQRRILSIHENGCSKLNGCNFQTVCCGWHGLQGELKLVISVVQKLLLEGQNQKTTL